MNYKDFIDFKIYTNVNIYTKYIYLKKQTCMIRNSSPKNENTLMYSPSICPKPILLKRFGQFLKLKNVK